MKLEPGLYKIRSRSLIESHFYLDVVRINGKIYYAANGGVASEADEFNTIPLEGYEVVKRITKPLLIPKASITLKWTDEEFDDFEYTVTDVQLLRNLFEKYPQIAKAVKSKKY